MWHTDADRLSAAAAAAAAAAAVVCRRRGGTNSQAMISDVLSSQFSHHQSHLLHLARHDALRSARHVE